MVPRPGRSGASALLALVLVLGRAVRSTPSRAAGEPSAEFVSLQIQIEDAETRAASGAHLFFSTRQAAPDVLAAFCWRHRCSQQQASQVSAVLEYLGNSSAQPDAWAATGSEGPGPAAELARRVRRYTAGSVAVWCGRDGAAFADPRRAPAAHVPAGGAEGGAEGGAGPGGRVDVAVLMHHAEGYSELAELHLPCSRAGFVCARFRLLAASMLCAALAMRAVVRELAAFTAGRRVASAHAYAAHALRHAGKDPERVRVGGRRPCDA